MVASDGCSRVRRGQTPGPSPLMRGAVSQSRDAWSVFRQTESFHREEKTLKINRLEHVLINETSDISDV